MDEWLTDHFKAREFDSPDQPGSGARMNRKFMERLEQTRVTAGIPFIINSGFRTVAHNKAVGGVQDSAHMKGMAADVRAVSTMTRYKILHAAVQCGWTRIGIAREFIHLDDDPTKPQNVVWFY